ncbi:hypothetical protein [Peribacillus saganii]|nr:hypothetical protein [Peribacillus saganii]
MKTKDDFSEGAKVTKDNQTFAPESGNEKNKNQQASGSSGSGNNGSK